jgi:hypothetical protein
MLQRRQPMPKLVDYKAKYREALRVMDQAIAGLKKQMME